MHEVKVYDASGNLKKVISTKALNTRSTKQLEMPSMFLRNKKGRKSWSKSTKSQTEVKTS